MRLSLLFQREPFGKILEQTLGDYWSETTSCPVQVQWGDGFAGRQCWRGNVYLNFFCVTDVAPECFEIIICELGRARSPWGRWPQAAYVKCATTPPMRDWLSHACFGVSPAISLAREQLVVGGNRRLRLIHPAAGVSVVIHKAGFSRLGFDREVRARKGLAASISPRLLAISESGLHFTEEYFVGTPANRLPLGVQAEVRGQAVEQLIAQVHRPSLRLVRLGDHAHSLVEAIREIAPAVEPAGRSFAGIADRLAGSVDLGLVLSHGDFQDANLLVSAGGVRVIDWENATERSQVYDLATLAAGTRQTSDWVGAWQCELNRWIELSAACPQLEVPMGNDARTRAAHGAVWFLEEVLFRLEDAAISPYADIALAATEAIESVRRAGVALHPVIL